MSLPEGLAILLIAFLCMTYDLMGPFHWPWSNWSWLDKFRKKGK